MQKKKKKRLVHKSDISGFVTNSDLYKEVATLATKAELKVEKDKVIKLQAFDSSYFGRKNHFENDRTQNYLVFQPIYRYFIKLVILIIFQNDNLEDCIMNDEIIELSNISNNSLVPPLSYFGNKVRIKFDGSCLK